MNAPTSSITTAQATAGPSSPVPAHPWEAAAARSLFLINGEHYSGAERVQDLLATRLPELGYQVAFACLKPGKFAALRRAQAAPLVDIPMRSRADFSAVQRLRAVVREHNIDLLHAHTPRTVMIGSMVARWTGLPMIYHVHSPVGHDSQRRWQNWLNGQIERFSLSRVNRMITVSASLADYMVGLGYQRSVISVVPNGVPRVSQLRSPSPPEQPWTLGTVALFRPRKGTEVLLHALAELRGRGLDVRLRAVGGFETDAYRTALVTQVGHLGLAEHVDWSGFTQDVEAELRGMDLFVLPSLFGEGLPMVVLESMAMGLPVVATRVQGVPEAIRDGIDGMLAQPGDAQDLAEVLSRVIGGEVNWSELRSSALQRHDELFSDTSMARGVAAVYQQVLGRPARLTTARGDAQSETAAAGAVAAET